MSLRALAQALGVEAAGVRDETLFEVVRALHPAVEHPDDAAAALADLRAERTAARVDPVVVAWGDARPVVRVRLPALLADAPLSVAVEHDDGELSAWPREECSVRVTAGGGRVTIDLELPVPVRPGAHRLAVECGRTADEATLLAAPARVPDVVERAWGVFAPVYALHARDRATTGDLGTFARLAAWAGARGAAVVGTLPLLATFVGHGREPCDPSPYAAVSRRFWNEVFLDLTAVPELAEAPPVPEPSPGAAVDLPALAAVRRPVLAHGAAALPGFGRRLGAFRAWSSARPDAQAYARFRAAREGDDGGADVHLYAQWLAHEQLGGLAAELSARGQALYLDLPVGSHREGFDVATQPELFVPGLSVGAPPDAFHCGGQDWGFPPPDPAAARRTGHAHLRACLAAHFAFARLLRLDHVMGLHRLWVIPGGAGPADGAYLRFPADEQWAAVCIEAARAHGGVVGENLGTVPPETEGALAAHGVLGTWVAQFAPGAGAPPARSLACVDTHDLPTFASWWHDLDPARRGELLETLREAGALDTTYGEILAPDDVHAALLEWLGASDAALVLVTLEDLWLEAEAQNRPGTHAHQSFRRRFAYGVDDLDALDAGVLARLDGARRRRPWS